MNVCGERIRALRESMNYSQMKFAQIFELGQSSVVRYEKGEASPPLDLLVRIADYFDVSLDYIFGRTDNPQGKLYEYHPQTQSDNPELKQFIEMCFDPTSAMHAKFKDALFSMLSGGKDE